MYNLPPQVKSRIGNAQFANFYTFIVCARHMSFKAAAAELSLTESAVSHRIRRLEQSINTLLFKRQTRRILLTDEGERLYCVLQRTIGELSATLQPQASEDIEGRITVFARPSLAQRWLVPLLSDFASIYPKLSVDIRVGNQSIDFRTQMIDIAIDYANGDFPGLASTKLMLERVAPVCSPNYASKHSLYNQPQNLSACTLLHDSLAWRNAAYDAEWMLWAKNHQFATALPQRCFTFDSSDLCFTAAVHGIGIAIGREQLVKQLLDRGELVLPFGDFLHTSSYSYYAVYPQSVPTPQKTLLFLSWLKKKIEGC